MRISIFEKGLKSRFIILFNCLVFKSRINIFLEFGKFSSHRLSKRKRTIWRDFLRVSKAFLSATRQSQRINFHCPVKFKIFNEKYLPRVDRLKIRVSLSELDLKNKKKPCSFKNYGENCFLRSQIDYNAFCRIVFPQITKHYDVWYVSSTVILHYLTQAESF